MKVITLTTGQFAENCYLAIDTDSGEAAVIDPGEEAGVILARLATEGVHAAEIWLTHAHVDHVAGVAAAHDATGAPIRLHPADRPLYDRAAEQAGWLGLRLEPLPDPALTFEPEALVTVGALSFEVRHTPGHSPGSVTLVGHGAAFVGDVLFAGSVGRVDLPGGDGPTLVRSIESQLLTLPDETIVYSGHGPATTIGEERRTNPFLTGAARIV